MHLKTIGVPNIIAATSHDGQYPVMELMESRSVNKRGIY
jgi:hypothetical protein